MNISDFAITRYRVYFQATCLIQLPDYAGSTLRGAFGHALKSIACLSAHHNKGQCRCQPANRCLYRQLFDPEKKQLGDGRIQTVAPPIIIEPLFDQASYCSHQQGHFDFVLLGQVAHQQFAIIQLAWQKTLNEGIGVKDQEGKRGTAQLLRIDPVSQPVNIYSNPVKLSLQLLTPLRLSLKKDLIVPGKLTACVLVWAIIRRYNVLAQLYANQCAATDYEALMPCVAKVGLDPAVRWQDWIRYSNRQKQQMTLGGLVGHLMLDNVSDEIWHYLYIGQWLHAGKNCVFGLGHYQIVQECT